MILVIGATGKVGRHVVSGLVDRGVEVRALSRDPGSAGLPSGVDIVPGDVMDATSVGRHLRGLDAVFLLWPFFAAEGASELVSTLARRTDRIVYLSAEAAARRPDSAWAVVEGSIVDSGVEWTFLRPTGFAANTLMWAPQIRESGVVRWPYGRASRSLIHERDIAEVAVLALTMDGHVGARHVLTGPESLTQAEQAAVIGEAIGRPVRWEELSRAEAQEQFQGVTPDTALDTWAAFVDAPEVVTATVAKVTGHRARSFAEWAREHAAEFGGDPEGKGR